MTRTFAALLSGCLLVSSSALAAPPPTPLASPTADDLGRAKELFENGRLLFQEGSYDPAILAFRQAYQLAGDPVLLYNIALAYDRLERHDDAIEYLEHYRAFAPASERQALADRMEGLRKRKLRAAAEDREREEAQAAAGEVESEDEAEASDTASPPPAPVAQAQPAVSAPEPQPIPDRPEDEAPRVKVYGPAAIALTVVTAATLASGLGFGLASNARRDDARDLCSGDPLLCPEEARDDLDTSRGFAIGADVSFGIAAAAGVSLVAVIAANAVKRKRARSSNARAHLDRARVQIAAPAGQLQLRF